jgi:FkbM family methyltransferase
VLTTIKGALRRHGFMDRDAFRGFLRDVRGVIHVGAHTGEERALYAQYRLKVLWVEPLAEHFATLQQNISAYPDQRAVQYLVTDRNDEEYAFHVTSNEGASSSIFTLDLHKDIWPEVEHARTVHLKSKTLPTVLEDEHIDVADYDGLIMDTQGSELLVLNGAESILDRFRYIKTEVADFAAYEGCCQLDELEAYVARFGFVEIARKAIASHPRGGAYYDVVYKRRA